MKIKQKDADREKAKNIMRKVLRFAYEEKFEDINSMILNTNPEQTSLREFTVLIRSTYSFHHKMTAWLPKLKEFHQYHKSKGNEKDFNNWMVGLQRYYIV